MPPMMGQIPGGQTGMDNNMAGGSPAGGGGGSDAARQALQQAMGDLRGLKQQIEQIGEKYPTLSAEVKKMLQIWQGIIVKVAQQAPQQTQSSQDLPMGGG